MRFLIAVIDSVSQSGSGNEMEAIDAPLYDNPEFMSGFWLIHAADLEEAKALASAGSKACNRRVELRPLLG
jgi:hypothetical protein